MFTYEQFIDRVQWVGHLDSKAQAEKAARATLEILARRIGRLEAHHLLKELPAKAASYFRHEREQERFGLDEFFDMVAEHEGVTFQEAVNHSRAVIAVLQETISKRELNGILSGLPEEYRQFFSQSALSAKAERED